MSIEQTVIRLVAEQANMPVGNVTLDKSLVKDLELDSLDVVELGLIVEWNFNLEFPDAEVNKWTTVQDVLNSVNLHKKN